MSAAEIVNKVWNYAHVLRDDGVGYGDYVEAAHGIQASALASCVALSPASRQSSRGIRTSMFVTIAYLIFLTYLHFVRRQEMADERSALTPALSQRERGNNDVPDEYNWAKMVKLDGDDLELQYLGKQGGMLGTIFRKGSYGRGVLFHLFGEFWRTTYSFEYRYLSEGIKT